MKAEELYKDIRQYCKANADEAVVKKYSRFFKEGYDAYGLTREKLEEKVNSILRDKKVNMKLVLSTSRLLVKSGKYEETSFAIRLLKEFSEQFTAGTFKEIGKWFEIGIINWGHTDAICGMIISEFFERKIISLNALEDWRMAKNKYQRRAVPVAMIEILKETADFQLDRHVWSNQSIRNQGCADDQDKPTFGSLDNTTSACIAHARCGVGAMQSLDRVGGALQGRIL